MQFPAMLYQSPGQIQKPGSAGTYKIIGVQTQEEADAKLSAGWFASSDEAIIAAGDKAAGPVKIKAKWLSRPAKKRKPSKPLDWRELAKAAAAAPKDDAPPTRQELELKARELDIRFDGRTPDRKLGQLIQHRITGV